MADAWATGFERPIACVHFGHRIVCYHCSWHALLNRKSVEFLKAKGVH